MITREEWSRLAVIEAEHPGWEAWISLDGQWHARIRNAIPPVMVHGNDADEVTGQITAREAAPG